MPDHAHLIWLGWSESSDQQRAVALLRTAWNAELRRTGRHLQRQAYDHVLREKERTRRALARTCEYVFENPVRAGLVVDWRAWKYSGAVMPGYPLIDPREELFWSKFWRIHAKWSEGAAE